MQILKGQSVVEKGYFLFPIKPGQRNYLTGSMGELRSNHFHAGIDIKTDFKIGLPVYCSADGYVSRIKISSFGYGKVLYITHPNGLTTVYAHLDQFSDTIGAWALKKQYELESFDFDVLLGKDELPVKKGQIIARSGNTGSSGGPHLHYEIRDKSENVWNPLLFDFKEIKDTELPIFDFVALRSFGINSRIESEFGRKDFQPIKISEKNYVLSRSIDAIGDIGIELKAHDRMNETFNQYGVSCIEVKVNGKETFFHNITTFSFEDGKKINAHLDYQTLVSKNQRFQRCYVSDGNTLRSYKNSVHNGKLMIEAGKSYKIEITIYDAFGNNSTLSFTIQGKESSHQVTSTETSKGGYRIFENILKIKGKDQKDTLASFYINGNDIHVSSAYLVNGFPVYLYDLRNGLPDSVQIGTYKEDFDFVSTVLPFTKTKIKFGNFLVQFSDSAIIDTLYLQMKSGRDLKGKPLLEVHDASFPIFGGIELLYSPNKSERITPQNYIALNGRKYEKTVLKEDNLLTETKNLGKFLIVKDSIKPSVKYISHTAKSIKFNIFDTGSGIDSFKASINGKWLLMNYEHKNKTIWSESFTKSYPLKGKFVLEVKDKAGNIQTYERLL
ncbi:MAG TPA: M23 family metallopeptidase [Cytophagaceae bacterium]|nr:M23 family metallopeptidase [Cytophagaceae bacterium]